jgi:hypothetical protein
MFGGRLWWYGLIRVSPFLLCLPLVAGSIEGRVTNRVTGEAVGGVEVRFLDAHSRVFQTVTDSSGTYRLANLQDGDYSGGFSKDGFQDISSNLSAATKVSGDVAGRADAQLNPWGGLRGRVVGEDGKPAAKVRVELDKSNNEKTTDENGEFYFQELRPGSYSVVAKPEPVTRMEEGVKLGAVPIYYPAATQLADAVPVTVGWGADMAGITIALKSVPVHRVTGVILDPAGKPVAHAAVKLLGRPARAKQVLITSVIGLGSQPSVGAATIGPGRAPEVARVESREDGTFEFPVVEQGDWRVSAEVGGDEERPMEGVVSAAVADKDIEDVRIRLSAPFAVAITRATSLVLIPMEGQPHLNLDPASNVGKINGLLPGRYRVPILRGDGATYVASVILGGVDVLGQEIELADGSGPFEIVMKHDTGSLRGTVENGEGANVLLIRRELGDMVHYRQVACGAGGAFQFDNAVPGDYYVVAFERASGRELPVENLPDSIVPLATGVRVEPGSTATVQVRISPWP